MEKCAKCKRKLSMQEMFTAYTCSKCGKTYCGFCAGAGSGSVLRLSCPKCDK